MAQGDNKNLIIAVVLIVLLAAVWAGITLWGPERDNSDIQGQLAEQKSSLVKIPGTLRANWLRTLNPGVRETEGELLWNNDRQQGVMVFHGLPELSGNRKYQLWIFDLKKELAEPVLAGNFFGSEQQESAYMVAIRPVREIHKPLKFVITTASDRNTDYAQAEPILMAQP